MSKHGEGKSEESMAERETAEEKLAALREMIISARSMPMSASCVINRNDVLSAIDDVIQHLPDEIAEAQDVLDTSKATIAESQDQAAQILAEARDQAADLARHDTIAIRQGDDAYGVWRLQSGKRTETVKVQGPLSSNDGEIAVQWALAGHGIVMRAEWDVARYLRSGRLREVLANWHTPPADVYAVYPVQQQGAARVRAFVEHLAAQLRRDSGPAD